MQEKILKNILKRLEILEEAIFGQPKRSNHPTSGRGGYSGATGGIRFLITKGWFKTKRDFAETRKKLAENGYHYSRQAAHEALKLLSKARGPFVVLKEKGKKVYAERK